MRGPMRSPDGAQDPMQPPYGGQVHRHSPHGGQGRGFGTPNQYRNNEGGPMRSPDGAQGPMQPPYGGQGHRHSPHGGQGRGFGTPNQYRNNEGNRGNRSRSRSSSGDRKSQQHGNAYGGNCSTSMGYGNSPSPHKSGTRWDEDPLIFLSRTLSSILRHNAEKFGFKLMKGGFLYVDEILKWTHKLKGYTNDDVMSVVQSNDKQRFTVEWEENGRPKIRANQGHTLEVEDLDLKPIVNANDFTAVIHGTYYEAWEIIKRTGLNRMNRNHIHFAPGEPGQGGVISGMRSSCQVMIYLDLEKALKDGLKFFVSSNNVILSTGDENGSILPRYFIGAKDRRYGYKLDFDPNVNPDDSYKKDSKRKREKGKSGRKNKKEEMDNVQSEGVSTDDAFSPPAKVQALDDSAVGNYKIDTSTESLQTPDESFGSNTEDSAMGNDKTDTSTESHPTPDESIGSNTEASADDSMNENIRHEETKGEPQDTGILSQLVTDYGDEDRTDSEEPDMEMVEISDPEVSKCTIDAIMNEQPRFVVVSCCGKNLGKKKSCINQLLVGTRTHLFIFKLKEKSLMDEGNLRELLLDTHIQKVFFRIGEVSSSLINEYNILLNGVPIWDIEILHDNLSGKLPAIEQEFIMKEMGSSFEFKDPEEIRQQARMMYKMFPLLEKKFENMSDINKRVLKKDTYAKAMPVEDDHFLAEKIKSLKMEQKQQKEKLKKMKTENNSNSAAAGGKTVGKGGQNNKKSKNKKK